MSRYESTTVKTLICKGNGYTVKHSRKNIKEIVHNHNNNSSICIKKLVILGIIEFLEQYITKIVAIRLLFLMMTVCGLSNLNIKNLLPISYSTILKYVKIIKFRSIKEFLTIKGGGRKGTLEAIEQDVLDMIDSHNFHTRQQIADMIEEKFDIKTTRYTVGRFLKKHRVKLLKCGSLPAKADPEKQRTFYECTLRPLMNKAISGESILLFMDASHFVMGCDFLCYMYTRARRFIRTFSGRKRYNVLGALNMSTKKLTAVTNCLYITSVQVCELLSKIATEYVGRTVHIVLDNARYQKCMLVQEHAKRLGINLVFIPPYSPNLNLIERYWKYVKTKLRVRYYDNFDIFCRTIDDICSYDNNNKCLEKLIGEKVQLFDDLVPLNESTCVGKEYEQMAA